MAKCRINEKKKKKKKKQFEVEIEKFEKMSKDPQASGVRTCVHRRLVA
jgi:hypothetical protein